MSAHEPAPLSARDICVAYEGRPIIERLNVEIRPARFTALVGANGSGKSTLLRALAGLLPLRSGKVFLDSSSIERMPRKALGRRIGFLPQQPSAPDAMTVVELVRQGRYSHRGLFANWSEADESACGRALRLAALTTFRDRRLDTLSGGQRQRAWIAMTLAQRSAILLLDEPTTFLDIAHQLDLLKLIRWLCGTEGSTVVAVLHDLNQAARYADEIILMRQGAIEAAGAAADVLTPCVIERVFGVKTRIVVDPADGSRLVNAVSSTTIADDIGASPSRS